MNQVRSSSRLNRAFTSLIAHEAFAGILLIGVAALAMIQANSPLASTYYQAFHAPLPWTPIGRLYNAHLWINDALMAVFFFVVGLEVKREMIGGNLADARVRRLPVLAAAAGLAVPAVVDMLVAGSVAGLSWRVADAAG